MAKQVLRKIILPGTSDKDISGADGGFEGLEYTIYKPQPEHEIFNADLKPNDQVWHRPEFPDFSTLSKKDCQDIYIREIRRIKHGVYVWIGGVLEYITGKHYFGLTHWKLKESSSDYLIYTETQRNIFYMFDLCEHDPKCAGAIIFSLKRLGKSELAQIEMFADSLLREAGRYIVQALNDDEAIDIFAKTHYANENLHLSLPIWNYKISKADPPAPNLVALKRESTKDSIVWKSADGIEGSNEVSFSVKPTKLSGIQGKKIRRAFLDEFASLVPIKDMNLENYHSKAIAQVTEDFGAIVLGHVWLIATAENLKSEALKDAEEIWDGADETKKDANGFNSSKMKRMLIPYYLGGRSPEFLDKFGRPKIEAAKKFYENSIASKTEGAKGLFRRQNPETIADVFEIKHKGSLEEDVVELLREIRRNLVKEIKEGKVNVKVVKFFELSGAVQYNITNQKIATQIKIYEEPKPGVKYVVGIDGTCTTKETSENNDTSDFSFSILKAFEGVDCYNYTTVCDFSRRPEIVDDVHFAVYYASKYFNKYGGLVDGVLPETNQGGASAIVAFFTNKGERRLLKRVSKQLGTDGEKRATFGLYRDDYVKDMQIKITNPFIRKYGKYIRSIELIDDLLNIGKKNTDRADAFMMGIVALGNFEKEESKKPPPKRTHVRYHLETINGVSTKVWDIPNNNKIRQRHSGIAEKNTFALNLSDVQHKI